MWTETEISMKNPCGKNMCIDKFHWKPLPNNSPRGQNTETNKVLSHENKNGKEKNAFVIIILLTINLTNNSSEWKKRS